ncbi:major histocompatibility complex class I-related gene protein-like [Scomber scombrus]|uniref:Major histocompatibility complex class I-related gene protein-like n=1 Tax=Scomber scombrus TaxID=13677 RepID=A0AAV1QCB5_SCOSC
MGLLDSMIIDYYDSDDQKKVPKQDWMKERLPADYWEKGKKFCLSKQQWFKVNIDILKKRMNQNDDGSDGTLKFVRGVDMYNYNGQYFLSFNITSSVWVAATDIAAPNKRKWDEVQVLKENATGFLENECIDWLDKFVIYRKKQLKNASPPEVYVFAKKTRNETNLNLTCMATGFYTKDIILTIRRNNCILTKEDGLSSSGVRPNEDETFQRRDSVEILKNDIASFTCEVFCRASNQSVKKVWDHKVIDGGNNMGINAGAILCVVFVILVVVAVVLGVLYGKRIIGASANRVNCCPRPCGCDHQ